jgi:hypothetical protein
MTLAERRVQPLELRGDVRGGTRMPRWRRRRPIQREHLIQRPLPGDQAKTDQMSMSTVISPEVSK